MAINERAGTAGSLRSSPPGDRPRLGPIVATVSLSALVLAVLFSVWTVWGIRAMRSTLVDEARRNALALVESLILASQFSVATGALVAHLEVDAQATRARFLAALIDPQNPLSSDLATLARRSEVAGVTVWATGRDPQVFPPELAGLIGSDRSVGEYDWSSESAPAVEFHLHDSVAAEVWDGTGVPTAWGAVAVWRRAETDLAEPSYGGIGELIQQIASKSDVNYIILQSPEGIVFASRPLAPVLRLSADSFLVASLEANQSAAREIVFEGRPVLEAVGPFLSADLPSGMFRVGVSLEGVEEAQSRLSLQLGLSAVLFLLLATAVLAYLISRRSLSDLGRSYRRVETMTTRILNSMDQAVVAVDRSGRITVFNPAAERMTGRAADDVLGTEVSEALGGSDYDLRSVGGGGAAVRDRELRQRSREDTQALVYTTTPMRTQEGSGDGAVSVVRDETVARALAERVQRSERLSEMGDLAAGVAHEIRNPLNAIAIAAQRLRQEADSPEGARLAGTVWEESKRLNAIIEDYLSLARPANRTPVPVDFRALVSSVAEMVKLEADKAGIVLRAHYPEEPVTVQGVADELKKALWNVLANALAATEAGGDVRIRLRRSGQRALLTIADAGSGIAETDLSRVFQPYFTTKTGGTGLGLAITYRIITDHGGTIEIESPVPGADTGTQVTITLPIAEEGERNQAGAARGA